jgi:hypothetical protein
MKRNIFGLILLIAGAVASCKKENSGSLNSSAAIQQAVVSAQAVSVAASTTTSGDSVYVVHSCNPNEKLATIDFSNLPSGVTSYLSTNYSGYTAIKALSITNSSGTVTGYIAVIQYNGNPIGIKFDASGNFVKVLEQREGHDLLGEGWHHGGCFDFRDGAHRDTVALTSLPAGILTYMSANYPSDTVAYAFLKHNGEYVVISRNNGLYATVFSSAGTFVTHLQLPVHPGRIVPVDQASLPSSITNYLATTYPGYVFDKAFSFTWNGVLQGYSVLIDANNTKYALLFDASGNFVKVKVLP